MENRKTTKFRNLIHCVDIFSTIKYWYIRACFYYYKFFRFNYNKLTLVDSKKIPIIIISFNQLTYLEKLVNFLVSRKFTNIVIIDNNSTYKPLLDYFDKIHRDVKIHRLNHNYGHLVFWKRRDLYVKYACGFYAITDSDIVPPIDTPEDFLVKFHSLLKIRDKKTKVGFGLDINNIPACNKNKEKIIEWESKFWKEEKFPGVFDADIDTTFALYKPCYHSRNRNFYDAFRLGYPYMAEHGGWYIDTENPTNEQLYFMEKANDSSSWKINSDGSLANKEYQSKYNSQ